MSKRLATPLSLALSGLIASPLALSQSGGLSIEEVVVTAQKRDENLSEVPIAISNFSGENIKQTGVKQLKEVAEFIPNLSISSGTDFTSRVVVRGVGANSRNIGFDTRVGVYLDGVYLGQSPAINQELVDLERIEVLRGPQGTLFGKNTVAGAINMVSAKPEEEFSGNVSGQLGNLGARQLGANVNIPLGDKVFTKVSLNKQERDGFVNNVTTGTKLNNQNAFAARFQLFAPISDKVSISAAYDKTWTKRFTYTGDAVTDTFGRQLEPFAPSENAVAFNFDPTERRDMSGGHITVDIELDNGYALKSISAKRDTDLTYRNDTDYSPFDIVTLRYQDEYEQYSQEFQVISPAEGNFDYVAGLYLYKQDGISSRSVFPGAQLPGFFGVSTDEIPNNGTVETESVALYANANWHISDAWKLGLGLRWSQEEKTADWSIDGSGSGAFFIANGSVQDSRKDSNIAPSLSLNYAFENGTNAYVKYSSGFKSGGYNLDFLTIPQLAAGTEFDKETVDSYELGLKGKLFDDSVSVNLAVFKAIYDDYQVNQFIELGGGATATSIRNAAEVDTQGLELELDWLLSDQLKISSSFGLLDAEFSSFPGGGRAGADVSGNKLPYASDYSFNLGIQYYQPLEQLDSELMFRIDYAYKDNFFTDANNESQRTLADGNSVRFGEVEAYDLINARLSLTPNDGMWSVSIWGRNLSDEYYLSNTGRDFAGTLRHFAGVPRTYGIDLDFNF